MTHMPEARQRLASEMDKRRQELDLLWQDVASAGRISAKTLYSVRADPGTPVTPRTARKIEAGLQWQPGSVSQVLDGGSPHPLDSPAGTPSRPDAVHPEPEDDAMTLFPDDPAKRAVWRAATADEEVDDAGRIDLIRELDRLRREARSRRVHRAEQTG